MRISDWSSDVCSSDLGAEHGDLGLRGAAGGLRLLALPLPRRQAPVLLAADQPHGAAGGLRAAVLPALLRLRPDRHAYRGGAGALPVKRAAGGVDSRGSSEERRVGKELVSTFSSRWAPVT